MVTPLADVSSRVIAELLNDPRTGEHAGKIEVAADRGIITLSGSVPKPDISEAAEQIARNTPGVITVHNELRVAK
ncbi:MAG: BON domain-containing protein [Omnitrophica WOR_2 bacterium]